MQEIVIRARQGEVVTKKDESGRVVVVIGDPEIRVDIRDRSEEALISIPVDVLERGDIEVIGDPAALGDTVLALRDLICEALETEKQRVEAVDGAPVPRG